MAKLTVEILQEKHAAALEELALKRNQTTESLRDEIMKTGMGGPLDKSAKEEAPKTAADAEDDDETEVMLMRLKA